MDIDEIIKIVGISVLSTSSLVGIIVYISKKIFENKLNILKEERLHRFSNIYTDKFLVHRELYKRVVIAEKSLDCLMRPIKIKTDKSEEDAENETANHINSFYAYFDENEIIFDENEINTANLLRENFNKSWGTYQSVKRMESARGTEAWANVIEKSNEVYHSIVEAEIPKLRNELKNDFQKKYKILEIY